MRLEKPLVRIHVLVRAQAAQPRLAAGRIEMRHPVQHQQHRLGQPRPICGPIASLAPGEIDARVSAGHQQLPLGLGGGQAHLVFQGLTREEPEDGVHLIYPLLAQRALHLEGDDDHRPGAGGVDAADPREQGPRVRQQLHQLSTGAVQVAKCQLLLHAERAAHVGSQPAAGLQRGLQQDGEGHRPAAVFVQVPGVRRDVVLHIHRHAVIHGADIADHASHAREKMIRGIGQPGHAPGAIEPAIDRAEGLGGAPVRAGEQRTIVEGKAPGLGHWPGLLIPL